MFCEFALFLFFRFRLRCSPRSDLLAFVANEKLKLIEHFYREANVCMGLRKQQRQTPENTNNNNRNNSSDVSAHNCERAIIAAVAVAVTAAVAVDVVVVRRRRCRRSCVNYAIYCRRTVEPIEMLVNIIFEQFKNYFIY